MPGPTPTPGQTGVIGSIFAFTQLPGPDCTGTLELVPGVTGQVKVFGAAGNVVMTVPLSADDVIFSLVLSPGTYTIDGTVWVDYSTWFGSYSGSCETDSSVVVVAGTQTIYNLVCGAPAPLQTS